MRRVIVVGAGPAGMMAAIAAAERGAETILWDANEKTGKKLYITGKGRCNLTNACSKEDFYKNIPRNVKFLMSSFTAFDNMKLMDYIEGLGVPLKVERGDRVLSL
jgi:predicted flavoprotein YhiN